MADLRNRFAEADRVRTPDVWADAEARAQRIAEGTVPRLDESPKERSRLVAAIVAFAVFGAAAGFAWSAWRPASTPSPVESTATPPAWLVQLAATMASNNRDPDPASARWLLTDQKTAATAVGLTADQVSGGPEYLVVLTGHFTAVLAKGPIGAPAPEGTTLVFTADPATHMILDWGVSNESVDIPGLRAFSLPQDSADGTGLVVTRTLVLDLPMNTERFEPPPADAKPALTPEQAIAAFRIVDPAFKMPPDATVWLGSYTAAVGDGSFRFDHRLAWGVRYHECLPPQHPVPSDFVVPCIRWLFLDANTGRMLEDLAQLQGAQTAPPSKTSPSARRAAAISLGGVATGGVSAFGSEWVMLPNELTIARVDPVTGAVTATVSMKSAPLMISADTEAVWVLASGSVSRIDPKLNTVTLESDIPSTVGSFALANGDVYLADSAGRVSTLDGDTGKESLSTKVVKQPTNIVGSSDALVVADSATATLYFLNPSDLSVIGKLPIRGEAGLAYGSGFFWITSTSFGTIDKVDAQGNVIDTIQVVQGAPSPRVFFPIASGDSVWVVLGDSGVYQIDASTDLVTGNVEVPGIIGVFADTDLGTVWTMDGGQTITSLQQSTPA